MEAFLQASPRGDGSGMALVPLNSDDGGCRMLRVTVLPKVWAKGGAANHVSSIDLDRRPEDPRGCLCHAIYEQQVVRLTGQDAAVTKAVTNLTGLQFDSGDSTEPDRPRTARLFERTVSRALTAETDRSDEPNEVAAFWSLMAPFNNLLTIPVDDGSPEDAPTYVAQRLLQNAPELEPLVRHAFVREAETFVRRRRPEFRHHIDEMTAVRGRIVVSGLSRRAARGQQALICEFDDLDSDSDWQRLIRFAARLVAGSAAAGNIGLSGRAARIDRLLADCRLLHVQTARQLCSRRSLAPPRKARFGRHVLELARWLILARFPFGGDDADREPPPALACGVRVPTSKLLERLLDGVRTDKLGTLRRNDHPVPIRWADTSAKHPDLVCMDDDQRPIAYADAKYKLIDKPAFTAMSMSDQYQQYAYAVSQGVPNVFIYLRESTSTAWDPVKDHTRVNDEIGPEIAVAAVPFPDPHECGDVDAWRKRASASLATLEFQADDKAATPSDDLLG